MRCAVDGCRPVLLADRFQRDRILVRGQHVQQAEGTLEHLDRDAAVLGLLHAEFSPDRRVAAAAAAIPLRTAPSSVAGKGPST